MGSGNEDRGAPGGHAWRGRAAAIALIACLCGSVALVLALVPCITASKTELSRHRLSNGAELRVMAGCRGEVRLPLWLRLIGADGARPPDVLGGFFASHPEACVFAVEEAPDVGVAILTERSARHNVLFVIDLTTMDHWPSRSGPFDSVMTVRVMEHLRTKEPEAGWTLSVDHKGSPVKVGY